MAKSKWLSGSRINPKPIQKGMTAADLIDATFLAYNAGRLQKAARLFVEKMLADDAVVGLSLTGALTPAGLGGSVIIPLLRAGFVDWIVSTSTTTRTSASASPSIRARTRSTIASSAPRASSASTTSCSTTRCCSRPTRTCAR